MATQEENGDGTARRSTFGLAGEAVEHVTDLVRGEIDLARAEVQEKINNAVTAIGLIVGGVVLLLVALNVFAAALVAWLVEMGIDDGWAALIIGVVFAAIGAAMAMKGRSDLRLSSIAPTRTAKNVRRDAETIKESTYGR